MYLLIMLSTFGFNTRIKTPEIYPTMDKCIVRAAPLNKTKFLKAWCAKLPTEDTSSLPPDCQKCVIEHLQCTEDLISKDRVDEGKLKCDKKIDKCSKEKKC